MLISSQPSSLERTTLAAFAANGKGVYTQKKRMIPIVLQSDNQLWYLSLIGPEERWSASAAKRNKLRYRD